MPVTKTAKRALRGSLRKAEVNDIFRKEFEIFLRRAKKTKNEKDLAKAASLADRAAKRGIIHTNKAGRIKSFLSKLSPHQKSSKK